jgi:hypothetical protein
MMGGLLATSLISGAGQGLANVANTVLDVGTRSVLQTQREEWEQKRLEQTQRHAQEQAATTEAYASSREQRGYTHAKELLTKKLAADEANTGQQISSHEAMSTMERDLKMKLSEQEQTLKGPYYDAMAKYYRDRGTAAVGKSGAGETPTDKKAKEFLESVTAKRLEGLYKLRELVGPDEKAGIQAEIEQVVEESRRVANVGAPPTRKPIIDPDNVGAPEAKDQVRNPAVPGGQPSTAEKSVARSGEDFTVNAQRPFLPRGRVEPARAGKIQKQQLDYDVLAKRQELDHAKIHGNPERVALLENQLRALEARQDSGVP